jgi:hypothetical protein
VTLDEARLVYDSAQSCATVGSRSGLRIDRSLVFQTDEYTLDVVLHAGLNDWNYLYGQVVRHTDGQAVEGALVRVEDSAVGPVDTDEHGQFTVEAALADERQVLRVEAAGAAFRCTIPSVEESQGH